MDMNERGQGMSINVIVMIILAVVVLVFLVYGFTVGWTNLFDNLGNFGGGESNVQTIIQACGIACSTNSQFDYNTLMRDVKFGDGNKVKASCENLESPRASVSADHCEDSSGNALTTQDTKVKCETVTDAKWVLKQDGWTSAIIKPKCTAFN